MKKYILLAFLFISLKAGSQDLKFEKNDLSDTLIGTTKIWTITDITSEFPGGEISWKKFLSENISLKNISGSFDFEDPIPGNQITIVINVTFIVRENGNVVNIKNADTNGNNGTFAKEAIRVVSLTPRWKPAFQNGKYVNSHKKIPIKFELKIK